MRGRSVTSVFVLGTTTVVLASCGGPPESPEVAAIRTNVPPMLLRIDEKAESVVATVPTGDWPRVFADVRDINDLWAGYQRPTVTAPTETLRPPGTMLGRELGAAVATLRRVAAARDSTATMKAANTVSARALDLFEYYRPAIPPDVRRLRSLERQIVIDAADRNLGGVSQSLNRLQAVWRRARTSVLASAGDTVVHELEENIAAQRAALAARDHASLTYRAENALVLLGEIQEVS
jgi:hypothetical protein